MKMKKYIAITVAVACGFSAPVALAGQWSAKTAIGKLTVKDDQTVLVSHESGIWTNPDLCDKDTQIILLPPGAEGGAVAYKEVYASLLGAHLTGREIKAFVDGCTLIGNRTYPSLKRIAVF